MQHNINRQKIKNNRTGKCLCSLKTEGLYLMNRPAVNAFSFMTPYITIRCSQYATFRVITSNGQEIQAGWKCCKDDNTS